MNRNSMKRLAKTCAAACVLLAASVYMAAASAQSADAKAGSPIEISGNVGLVSDYRWRGISLSDRDPAIQGGIDVSHDSGFFVGTRLPASPIPAAPMSNWTFMADMPARQFVDTF